MVWRLLMVNIAGSRESTEIAMSIAKMLNKISISAFNGRPLILESEVLLKERLLGEYNIGEVDHLLVRHWRGRRHGMIGEIREIVNAVENSINWLRDIIMHVI
jgi:hypothetical protein